MVRSGVALAFAALTGAAASQAPAFVQDYRQRIGGAIEALTPIVERFEANAGAAGLDRASALARYASGGDPFMTGQGVDMRQTLLRHARLVHAREGLDQAGALGRVATFLSTYDAETARGAMADFEPALPMTAEGVAFAGAGFAAGFATMLALWSLIARPFRRRPRPLAVEPARERP